jgi:hypothetical protein
MVPAKPRSWLASATVATLLVVGSTLAGAAAPRPATGFDLRALAPGLSRAVVEERLAAAGVRALPGRPRELRVEGPLIPRVFARQSARLELDGDGLLLRAAVQIVPAPGSTGEDLLTLYDDVFAELLRALGRPAWDQRQGRSRRGDELWALASGELVRAAEWRLPHPLRLSIPRRGDGRMLVEVAIGGERAAAP